MTKCLHLPLDFDRREAVRLFMRKLRAGGSAPSEESALLLAYQIWAEWGTVGTDWRPLRRPVEDWRDYDWQNEDLTFAIERFGAFKGADGSLIRAALDSGMMVVETRNDVSGLILTDFTEFNAHLAPGYRNIHERGGDSRAAKRRLDAINVEAADRLKLIESQGSLPLNLATSSETERQAAIALVIRLDRACGRKVRANVEYQGDEILRQALEAARSYTPDEIDRVEKYILTNRDNPRVVKITERILGAFAEILHAASAA